jgi:Bacterial PH domain
MPADSDAAGAAYQPAVTLPHTFRPLGARIATGAAAVTIVAAVTFLWVMLPSEVQDEFSLIQRLTLLVFFAAVLVLLNAIFRTSARASEDGLIVVNGYKRRELEWSQIVRISLTPNRPWALMDLDDGTTLSVMAIQTSDGARATRSARQLAVVIARHTRTERDE